MKRKLLKLSKKNRIWDFMDVPIKIKGTRGMSLDYLSSLIKSYNMHTGKFILSLNYSMSPIVNKKKRKK